MQSACRVKRVKAFFAQASKEQASSMEAPARGMLRRPIGLLASTTTRADKQPEAMGHAAVQVMAESNMVGTVLRARTAGGEEKGHVVRAQAPLPLAKVQARNSEGEAMLVHVKAMPMSVAQMVNEALVNVPWGKVVLPSGCASFGVGGCDEMLVESVQQRVAVVDAARSKALARRQMTHYKCMCCRKLVPNEEKTCASCGYTRAAVPAHEPCTHVQGAYGGTVLRWVRSAVPQTVVGACDRRLAFDNGPLLRAPKQSRHSSQPTECRDCLGAHGYGVFSYAGHRSLETAPFRTIYVTHIVCPIYSCNKPVSPKSSTRLIK